MGRSVADLERMARVLFGERDASRQEYFPAPVPYRDVTLPKTLRIGYYLNGASWYYLHNLILIWKFSQMVRSRALLLVTGPSWKQWRRFARKDMNASRSNPQIVRVEAPSKRDHRLSFSFQPQRRCGSSLGSLLRMGTES